MLDYFVYKQPNMQYKVQPSQVPLLNMTSYLQVTYLTYPSIKVCVPGLVLFEPRQDENEGHFPNCQDPLARLLVSGPIAWGPSTDNANFNFCSQFINVTDTGYRQNQGLNYLGHQNIWAIRCLLSEKLTISSYSNHEHTHNIYE